MRQLLWKLGILLAALGLSACSDTSNIPDPTPLETIASPIAFTEVWERNVGGHDEKSANLMIATDGNLLYVSDVEGDVTALNAMSGKIVWEVSLNRHILSGPSYGDNLLILTTEGGDVLALNADNGKLFWQRSLNDQVFAGALVTDSQVVVRTLSDNLIALDNNTGKIVWQVEGQAPSLTLRAKSAPITYKGAVIVGFAAGQISTYQLSNGTPFWSFPMATAQGSFSVQRMIDVSTTPVIYQGVIYAASYQGNIAALDPKTGQPLWQQPFSTYSGLAIDGQSIFISDAKSQFFSIDTKTGLTNWQQNGLSWRFLTAPAILQHKIVVGDKEGYIYILSEDKGHLLGYTELSSAAISATPVVLQNTVFLLDAKGHLAAYRVGV
jgi:outer membrane protein assembly factor BamB